jgi:hypothetical protein
MTSDQTITDAEGKRAFVAGEEYIVGMHLTELEAQAFIDADVSGCDDPDYKAPKPKPGPSETQKLKVPAETKES